MNFIATSSQPWRDGRLARPAADQPVAEWFKMPSMMNRYLPRRRRWPLLLVALALGCVLTKPLLAEDLPAEDQPRPQSGSLEAFAHDFWQWRARYQPFSQDDIPRIERPLERLAGPRDWSA